MKIQIAENIRVMRKQRDMMQEQLAEALGVSVGAVSKWERGAAQPDLRYIVEMADLFGVSTDALLGYHVQSDACSALEERIHRLQREKNYAEAAIEAEKALVRYPNSFPVVYRCGNMYSFKGMETDDKQALERAIELLNHAVHLLPQNTDPEISELTVQAEIAQCYLMMGKKDQGLALLKKYNAGGVHNALIGLNYAVSEDYPPQEAEPYLMQAYYDCMTALIRTMTGYANYYKRQKDYRSALDATLWLTQYLESLKTDSQTVFFADKLCAVLYAACARLSEELGDEDAGTAYLQKALLIAGQFDAAPAYKADGMRFCIGDNRNTAVYDDLGASAMEAVEAQLSQDGWSESLRRIWNELTHIEQCRQTENAES